MYELRRSMSLLPLSLIALFAQTLAFAVPPPAKTTVVLQKVSVPVVNRSLGMGLAVFPPNAAKPRQKAIGPEVCYVLQGAVTIRIPGRPALIVHAGETFQLPAGVVHVTTAGPSGARVLAAWVSTPGKPFNIPMPLHSDNREAAK